MEWKQQIYGDVYIRIAAAEVGVQSAEDWEAAVGPWEPNDWDNMGRWQIRSVALPFFCDKIMRMYEKHELRHVSQ